MEYPSELLPRANYKIIDCELNDYYLIRFTLTADINEIWDNELKAVKNSHICSPNERIDDLSMSLLGVYNRQHIFLDFTEQGKQQFMHYCEPDEEVETPEHVKHFFSNPNRHFWCAPIRKLHNVDFDYTRNNESCVATCIVKHTPMRWNFWHFSLRWTINSGSLDDLEEKPRKKIARRIGHAARVVIAQFASIKIPHHPVLPDPCYCKN